MTTNLAGHILGGKYKTIKPLGKGGMGLVWHSHDLALDRKVAVKIIRPEYVWSFEANDAFIKEARVIARLEHPHILSVYDFGSQTINNESLIYLVMRLASGGTLRDRLKSGRLPLDEVKEILKQVCEALDYAHSKGVIHLDLKPDNILFDDQGNALVADFGLAKLLETATHVKADTRIGTPAYMPPEQFFGGNAGPPSDVYALGITIHEMVTGQLPQRGSASKDFTIILNETLSPNIRPIIEKATQLDSSRRYRSAGELAQAFAAGLSLASTEGELLVSSERSLPGASQSLARITLKAIRASPMWKTFLQAILIGTLTAFVDLFIIKADSLLPHLLTVLVLLVTLGSGYYWRNDPDKKWRAPGGGIFFAILSIVTAFALKPPLPPPTSTPRATPTTTPTSTVTPNQEATVIARIFATQTALAPTSTDTPTPSSTPTSTDIPTPTDTPTSTYTPLPDTPTPSPSPLPSPTNTLPPPSPPTPTYTPTPIPRPGGIFSFSALVDGRYQTYVYNLASSASVPLYIHDGVVDADIQPGAQRLAYRWAASGRGGIWRMDLDGNNQQMLTSFVEDRAPNWSADGTGIFLSSTRGGDRVSRVFRINADGSGELGFLTVNGRDPVELGGGQLLFTGWLSYNPGACGVIYYQWRRTSGAGDIVGTEGRVSDQCSDFRPDAVGNQVVFMRQENGQSFDIWRNQVGFDVQGSAVNITPNTPNSSEVLPIFSPDGQWIAFASNQGGVWGIYMMKADGSSELAPLLETPPGTNFSDWDTSRLSWAK